MLGATRPSWPHLRTAALKQYSAEMTHNRAEASSGAGIDDQGSHKVAAGSARKHRECLHAASGTLPTIEATVSALKPEFTASLRYNTGHTLNGNEELGKLLGQSETLPTKNKGGTLA
eukprot:1144916-Pelagomonas_calceolata.AAC.12